MLFEHKVFSNPDRRIFFALALVSVSMMAYAQSDPGPRAGAPGAGGVIAGLTVKEGKFFDAGTDAFTEVNDVRGTITADAPFGLGLIKAISVHSWGWIR